MKIYCVCIFQNINSMYKSTNFITLNGVYNLDDINYFARSSTKELCEFMCLSCVKKHYDTDDYNDKNRYFMYEHENRFCLGLIEHDKIYTTLIDNEYPKRIAYNFLDKIAELFREELYGCRDDDVVLTDERDNMKCNNVKQIMDTYQNPVNVDKLYNAQVLINDTKDILHTTVESLLNRGEKLDDLLEKSTMLSSQSKQFYKTAKRHNQCCKSY